MLAFLGSSDNKAFIARKGETIDATIESHIYQVRLKDSLLSSLSFGKARDAEVAWIDARLTYQVNLTIHLQIGEKKLQIYLMTFNRQRT